MGKEKYFVIRSVTNQLYYDTKSDSFCLFTPIDASKFTTLDAIERYRPLIEDGQGEIVLVDISFEITPIGQFWPS